MHVVVVDPRLEGASSAGLVVGASLIVDVLVQIVGRVVVGGKDVERVSIDLHVGANGEIGRRDERHTLVDVLVLPLVQELALDDARVLLGGLVNS